MKKNKQNISQKNKDLLAQKKGDPKEQIKKFRSEIKKFRSECMGPIFTCICCMRDLFKRSVEELKGSLEAHIINKNNMQGFLYFDESLKIKDEIEYLSESGDEEFKTKKLQKSYYLCKTCLGYLKKSKMPPMSFKNYLEPVEVPNCLKDLTDLEKQLIVKNLIFIKVHQLPKTRMQAMNDRVINDAIDDDNIGKRVKSLSRTEHNSGMLNIGLNRKLNMKTYHKQGLINPIPTELLNGR